jgi:YYY domain-containing protein
VYQAVVWLIVVELLGLLAAPLTFRLFNRLPDRGLLFSKALAILLITYVAWLAGLTHFVPVTRYALVVIALLLGVASFLTLRGKWREFRDFLAREWLLLVVGEVLFLAIFGLWTAIVAHTPEINHTEKPMDLAFLNACIRSNFFPPEDPWLAGQPISYYYMGHMMMGMLSKLTGIPSNISYNLSICLIPALTGLAAYGIAHSLIRLAGAGARRAVLYALFAPLLIAFVGNIEGVMEFIYVRGWGDAGFWQWASIKGLTVAPGGSQGGVFPDQTWWWWKASRVVDTLDYSKSVADPRSLDYTINEFPFFSFILGDMHPHMLSLPFLLMSIGLALNTFLSPVKVGLEWLRSYPLHALAAAVLVGALGFINVIDFPVVAALFGVALLVKAYGERKRLLSSVAAALIVAVPVVLLAYLLYVPFYLTLDSQVSLPAPVLLVEGATTQPLHYLLVWGLLAFMSISYLALMLFSKQTPVLKDRKLGIFVAGVALGPFALWAVLRVFLGAFDEGIVPSLLATGNRFIRILPLAVISGTAAYLGFSLSKHEDSRRQGMPLLLLAAGFYLIMGTELFRLNDLFGNRMNTVFKLYYQAWIFLGLAAAYGFYYWLSRPVSKRLAARIGESVWVVVLALLLACVLYYPVGAILDKTDGFGGTATLDGLAFLKGNGSGEYEAIEWLRNAEPGVIVEAVGDSYSEYARFSAATGLPAVIGWEGHEHQWRGSDRLFRGRKDDVASLYKSSDAATVAGVLEKYSVRYVVFGPRERAKYGRAGLGMLDSMLERAFVKGDVVIYEKRQ